jgi:hypothetical protein
VRRLRTSFEIFEKEIIVTSLKWLQCRPMGLQAMGDPCETAELTNLTHTTVNGLLRHGHVLQHVLQLEGVKESSEPLQAHRVGIEA